MMRSTAVVALLFAGVADAKAFGRGANAGHTFLGNKADMRPDVVAHTLSKVEDEWNLQVASFAECNISATTAEEQAECGLAPKAFQRSCSTVVSAMVQASNGDKADVSEYMRSVCDEDSLKNEGWRQERCTQLAVQIVDGMSDDAYNNRESFDSAKLCTKFWTKFSTEESARLQKERAEKEAQEKKEEEEREAAQKKAEEEEAAAEKQRQEEAAAEAKKKEEEEAAAAAEQAKEAKAAQEAEAAKLAEKNAEAERVAAEADAKLEEVKDTTAPAEKPAEQAETAAPAVAAVATNATNATAANVTVAANATAADATVAPANATNATTANKTA